MSLEMACRFTRAGFALEVDLTVGARETVLLTGANGSGKSTLLHLVAGLLAVEEGEIVLGGRTLDRAGSGSDEVFVQPEDRQVGLLPQGGALFGHLSALENAAFGPRARGASRAAARATAAGLLERFGIAELAERRPDQLSGGQRQRVAICRTMAIAPNALLLDEPTVALDDEGRTDVLSMLGELRDSFDGPVVVVTHEAGALGALADRELTVVMDGGEPRTGRVVG